MLHGSHPLADAALGAGPQPRQVGPVAEHDDRGGDRRAERRRQRGASMPYAIGPSASVAIRLPREMNRVAHTVGDEEQRRPAAIAHGVSTEKTPQAVATPLPPRNRSHTG